MVHLSSPVCHVNYIYWSAIKVDQSSYTQEGTSTPPKGCVQYNMDPPMDYEICSRNENLPDIGHIKANYGRVVKMSLTSEGTSTPPKGCVCSI